MSQGELDRFVADVASDPELMRDFRRLAGDMDSLVRWSNAMGYSFTRDEAERLHAEGELTDDDLDMVAGGWTSTDPPPSGGSSGSSSGSGSGG
jgi:predicted ribosomally synthesized peptide with nif11-like leader